MKDNDFANFFWWNESNEDQRGKIVTVATTFLRYLLLECAYVLH